MPLRFMIDHEPNTEAPRTLPCRRCSREAAHCTWTPSGYPVYECARCETPHAPQGLQPGRFVWSENEEHFLTADDFATREEAIADARENTDATVIYVGRVVDPGPLSLYTPDARSLLDDACCNMMDRAGDAAEDWGPDAESLAILDRELSKTIDRWFEETGQAWGFCVVEEVETHHFDPEADATA